MPCRCYKNTLLLVVLLLANWPANIFAAKNDSIKKEIDAIAQLLPDKALGHDFIISRAMQSSDSYRVIQSEEQKLNMATTLAQIPTEGKISIEAKDYTSRNEPTNPFSPFRQESQQIVIAGQKYFSSGTGLEAKLSRSKNALKIGGSAPFSNSFYLTEGSVTLSQELWKDSFGHATRLGIESAKTSDKALQETILDMKRNWQKDLRSLFYQAWLLQNRLKEANKIVDRREKLLDLTEVKTARGTAERPDLLQVRSSLEQAKLQSNWLAQNLADIWRNLVVVLDFPPRWLAVDPLLIPIKMDDPTALANRLCQIFAKQLEGPELNLWLEHDIRLQSMKYNLEATKQELEKANGLANPSFKLFASTITNGVDREVGKSFNETTQFEHPAYAFGFNVSMPISFLAEKAQQQKARADYTRSEANYRLTLDQIKVNWINRCQDFQRLKNHLASVKTIVEKQVERGQLEKRRYQVGRTNLYQALLAEDDLATSIIQEKETLINLNITAWDLIMMAEDGRTYTKSMESKQWNFPTINL